MGRAYNVVMVGMLVLLRMSFPVDIAQFNQWAQARDTEAIIAHSHESIHDKFKFLKGMGSFGVGRSGWRAEEIRSEPGGKRYVVFTSALTTQDYGDQVFEWDGNRLTHLVHERETRGVEVKKSTMELKFELDKKMANIVSKTDFVADSTAGKAFFVRLGDNYKVNAVFDTKGESVPFEQAGGVVSLPVGDSPTFSYSISYSGVVNRPRFAGAIVNEEVMLTNDYWWPHIARLPMKLTTTSHVPKDWIVVGQGDKLAERTLGEEKIVTYVNEMPVSYMSLSAGKFGYRERVVNNIKYFVASRELTESQMDDQLEFFPPVIDFFSKLKPHPYSMYGAVDTRLYGGGALEAYSYATYGTGWLPAEDAHEPSHTWWGGLIPNTYFESFWNESFAVFSEGFYAREGSIGDRIEKRLAFVSPGNASPAYQQAMPFDTGAEDGGIASTMGYGKGGDVLNQLEFEIGTEKMTQMLKEWLSGHKDGAPGNWQDFESVCGSEWKWFFDQWIRRTGWPTLTMSDIQPHINGVSIEVNQQAPYYRFKLEFAVLEASGWKLGSVDVIPDSTGKSTIVIPTQKNWKTISLDPFDRLLQPRRPVEQIRWSEGSRRMSAYDPLNVVQSRNEINSIPDDLNGLMLVGSPEQLPVTSKFWAKAGVTFKGNTATYKGITVELDKGAVVGIVEYEPGKFVGLRAGKTKYAPNTGIASVAVVDNYGRFLTGTTVPRTNGPWVRKSLN